MIAIPKSETLRFGRTVAADRTEPRARSRVLLARFRVNFFESVRERRLVKIPQRIEIVPAVVPHERVDPDFIRLEQMFIPRVHDFETVVLFHAFVDDVVAVDVQLIPRIVVNERAPRHHALALVVSEKRTPFLPGNERTDNGRNLPHFAFFQRCFARPRSRHLVAGNFVFAHRRFERSKSGLRHDGRAARVPEHLCAFHRERERNNRRHRRVLFRGNFHFLPNVMRTVAQHRAPLDREIAFRELRRKRLPGKPLGKFQRVRIAFELNFFDARAIHL